ncbi:hypothetical protein ACFP65_07765 [Marinilactibacillus sp. GCM10026970]|uniref:hypothetical protein n=1 Tax=Marinilactibacillus sp. GCM10026970 TaxID=3252642 RepID=UPI003623738E
MRKIKWSSLLLLFLIAGCSSLEESVEVEPKTELVEEIVEANTEVEDLERKFDYESFEQLYKRILKNLKIKDMDITHTENNNHFTAVDKSMTFGKRDILTLDGNRDSAIDPTQRVLYLENEEKSILIKVIIAYTEQFIGDDMVYYSSDLSSEGLSELNKKSELITLSYKNLLFTVVQTTDEAIENDFTRKITSSLINIIEKPADSF